MTAPEGFRLAPFWLAYAVVLVVLFVWASRLAKEAEARDKETAARESCPMCKARPCACFTAPRRDAKWTDAERASIPREAMWRAIERERGE